MAQGALDSTYYPFLAITPQKGYEDTIVGALGYPRMGRPGWRDIWVPRIGGELRVLDSRLAIRGGYSFRPSALPLPGDSTMEGNTPGTTVPNLVTLLDSGVHSISFGAGYSFGDRPHERGAPEPTPDPVPTPEPTAHVLPYDADGFELEPIDERSAQTGTRPPPPRTTPAPTPVRPGTPAPTPVRPGTPAPTPVRPGTPVQPGTPAPTPVRPGTPAPTPARPGTTPPIRPGTTQSTTPLQPAPTPAATAQAPTDPTAAAPADPATALADPSATDEPDADLPGITGQIDFFFRANLMQERVDTRKDISYGGSIFDVGIQMSLGWY